MTNPFIKNTVSAEIFDEYVADPRAAVRYITACKKAQALMPQQVMRRTVAQAALDALRDEANWG